jgi:hypothetical protein
VRRGVVGSGKARRGGSRLGMAGKAVMAGLGQARQGMAVKVRRGAVWSGVWGGLAAVLGWFD